jgi:hypothetical protein
MKKTFIVLGCIALLLFIFSASWIGYIAIRYSHLDSSSKAYVDTNIPIIISDWSKTEMQKRGSKELNQAMTDQQWNLSLSKVKQLGKVEKYVGCEGKSYISLSFKKGILFVAAYTAYANFQNGPAEIKLQLIRRNGQWQIYTLDMDSPIFAKSPTPSDNAFIPAKEAKKHIGENAVVNGTISEIFVSSQPTNVYLYLDGDIQHAQFTAVWPGTNDPPIKALKELIFKAEPTISVSGKITTDQGVPEIIVNSWDQIHQ